MNLKIGLDASLSTLNLNVTHLVINALSERLPEKQGLRRVFLLVVLVMPQ